MKESQKRRYKSVEIVDQCIEKDAQWRSVRFDLDKLNADFNKANKAVAMKMKAGRVPSGGSIGGASGGAPPETTGSSESIVTGCPFVRGGAFSQDQQLARGSSTAS